MDSAVAYEAIDVGSNPSRSAVERLDCLSFYMYTNYNSIDNLEVLCYNCHTLTETFGSLNAKSAGRRGSGPREYK